MPAPGYVQACSHCHVESSPLRKEMMDHATAQRCVELVAASLDSVHTVDITGGAPELNAEFRCSQNGQHEMVSSMYSDAR